MTRSALIVLVWAVADLASAAAPLVRDPLPAGARVRIGSARLRHGGVVRALAFSPDGRTLASAGQDATLSLWDVSSGLERFRGRAHQADVLCVHFSPDGKLFASGGADGAVRVWNARGAKAGSPVAVRSFNAAHVEAVAFSPDGRWLAAGDDRGTVHLLEAATWRVARAFSQERSVQSLAWSANGRHLATRGDGCAAILWDPHRGVAVHRFGGMDPAECLCFDPSGARLAAWEAPGVLRVWDVEQRRLVGEWHALKDSEASGRSETTHQIAFTPDGRSLVAGNVLGKVEVWDPETGKKRETFAGHRGRVAAVAVSRDGLIASGGADHLIHLWKAGRREPLPAGGMPASPVAALSVPSGGDNLAVLRATGAVQFYNRTTGLPGPAGPNHRARSISLSPGGRTLVLADAKRLGRWDVPARKLTLRETGGGPAVHLALAAGGRDLITTHQDGSLWVRDANGSTRRRCQGQAKELLPVVSPDAKRVAGVGSSAAIPLWDAKSGKRLPPLAGHRGGSTAAAFSADGRRLVSGGKDRFARVWDLETQKETRGPLGHDAFVCAVAFAPSGKQVASGTVRGDVLIWSLESGALLAELEGHRGPVTGLAFAEGGRLISAGQDTTVLIWDVADALVGKAKRRPLSEERTLELWHSLRETDAALANLAVQRLVQNSPVVLRLARAHLRPVDGKRIHRLLAGLEADSFTAREKAARELEQFGAFAAGSLRAAIARKPGLESQRRLELLLLRAADEEPASVHRQALRGVEVLERIGSQEARKVLEGLAKGDPDAELTRRAKTALREIAKRR